VSRPILRSRRTRIAWGAGICALAVLASSIAQTVDPSQVIQARKQGLKALGAAFKVIRDELKGGNPDPVKIRAAAADIGSAARAIHDWFPAGSGPESGQKTDAREEIWSDAAGFLPAREHFEKVAAEVVPTFQSADAKARWAAAATTLGETCKSCHEHYRVKRE
jgi:cytochrome c556